jgi:hypothetical protein
MKEEKKIITDDKEIQKLKDIGLDKISNKTFINKENLTLVLDREFQKLEKTKCLGFIKILEREYDVDLSELKRDYLDYQIKNKNENTTESYVNIKHSDDLQGSEKNYVLLASIALATLALLWWLFLGDSKENIEKKADDLNVVKNSQVTLDAQENLSFLNTTQKDNFNDNDTINNTLSTEINSTTNEDDDFPKEVDLNKVVEEMFKEKNISSDAKDENSTSENNEDNKTDQIQETKQEEITPTAPTTKIEKELKTEEKKVTTVKKEKKSSQNRQTTPLSIIPTEKAWVGIFYLDEMKKKSYLKKSDDLLELDQNRDQLVLVGHRNFKIFSNSEEFKFKSKGMVRFSYINGELKEIDRSEYNRLSGGIIW